jgi:hypothetical protein
MLKAALLLLALTGTAMAKPLEGPAYDPMKQVPRVDGTFRDDETPPSDGEIALQMWRQHMGDAPMPPRLRQKYGLPPETKR